MLVAVCVSMEGLVGLVSRLDRCRGPYFPTVTAVEVSAPAWDPSASVSVTFSARPSILA